jgi:hypothetical protein
LNFDGCDAPVAVPTSDNEWQGGKAECRIEFTTDCTDFGKKRKNWNSEFQPQMNADKRRFKQRQGEIAGVSGR